MYPLSIFPCRLRIALYLASLLSGVFALAQRTVSRFIVKTGSLSGRPSRLSTEERVERGDRGDTDGWCMGVFDSRLVFRGTLGNVNGVNGVDGNLITNSVVHLRTFVPPLEDFVDNFGSKGSITIPLHNNSAT